MAAPIQLTRTHRILIGVIVTGTMVIAAIGFAGSYTAVRELARQKGFGNFSYLLPIGIDAGICVLLALDLLLTWIRIPFPLLRQTAWLLTAATIAFNGAAAWPDPLGVGMHAVIPILFVVSVEAARHAIGRIADITADKHMEGIRLTRWLLSPVPTFLLWRRMKLWELRSYEQVIKLEQERLIYQARLRSRFGRAWRRKAPVESLMPLRLARYGLPLAKTAPTGLTAAGIAPHPASTGMPLSDRSPSDTRAHTPASPPPPSVGPPAAHTPDTDQPPTTPQATPAEAADPDKPLPANGRQAATDEAVEHFTEPCHHEFPAWFHVQPTAAEPGNKTDDTHAGAVSTTSGHPHPEQQTKPLNQTLRQRPHHPNTATAHHDHRAPAGQPPRTHATSPQHVAHQRASRPDTAIPPSRTPHPDTATTDNHRSRPGHQPTRTDTPTPDHQPADTQPPPRPATRRTPAMIPDEPDETPSATDAQAANEQPSIHTDRTSHHGPAVTEPLSLTTVDRYYLAWMRYQSEHHHEPGAKQLSAYLAHHDMRGRGNKPVSPGHLRRYLLSFRLYTIWADHRTHHPHPSLDTIAKECAARAITAQYNKPITTTHLTQQTTDFERRWQTLQHLHTHQN